MANRYWVGGSGTWDTASTANWSTSSNGTNGASVPTTADSVFFDQNGPITVNLGSSGVRECLNITVTGSNYTFTAGTTLTCAGSLYFHATTVWPSVSINFSSIALNNTVTTNGATIAASSAFTFGSATGSDTASWKLGSNLTIGATLVHPRGLLDLNGFNITCRLYSSNVTTTRSIAFGSNNITMIAAANGDTVLNMASANNFTWTGTGGFISISNGFTRILTFGSLSGIQGPNLRFGDSTSAVATLTTGSYFNNLDFGSTTFALATTALNITGSLTLSPSGTYTALTPTMVGTGTITSNNRLIAALIINSISGITTLADALSFALATATTTLTSGTLNLAGFTLTTGIFSSTGSTTRSINFGTGGSIVLAHSTAGTTVLSMATVTGFTWTGTGGFTSTMSITRTFTFGTTNGSTTNAVSLTLLTGSAIATLTTGSYFNNLDFTSTTFALATTALNIAGSLTLSAAVGTNYTGLTVTMVGTGTITSNNRLIAALIINSISGITTLADALSFALATATTTLTSGTLNLAGFTLTTGIFSSTGSTTRSINFGTGGSIVLAHSTAGTTVLSMATVTGFTWTGTGGFTAVMSITRTFTFGSVAGGATTNSPNLTLLPTSTAVATFTTGSWFNILDFGSSTTATSSSVNLNNLILSLNGTYTSFIVSMRGTGTITSNNKTISSLTINNSGTTTLLDALSSTTFAMTAGTINFATFNLTCSSTATYTSGTFLNIGTITCTTFTVSTGTLTLTQGTITPSVSFVVSGSGTFNYNGGTLSPVPTFTHTAGTVTLGQPYALTATGTYQLTSGTLNLAGFTLTTGIFSSSGTSTRSINFGSNNIELITVLSITTATNFTWTGTGGFTTIMDANKTFAFGNIAGGLKTNGPNLTLISGTFVASFLSGSWFNHLNFGSTQSSITGGITLNLNSLTLSPNGTYTTMNVNLNDTISGNGILSGNGKTIATLNINLDLATITLQSAIFVTGVTSFNTGTLNLDSFTLSTGQFFSTGSTTRSINFGTGGNIDLTISSAGAGVLDMSTATNFTWTGTGGFRTAMTTTRTFYFGQTAGGSATNAPNLSLTSGASIPTFTSGSWFNLLNFTGSTCVPAITSLNLNGLTLSSGVTYSNLTLTMVGTGNITSNGNTTLTQLIINSISGTTTLGDPLTLPQGVLFISGTLELAGFNLTTDFFSSSNSNTRSIIFSTGNINLTGTGSTLIMGTSTRFTWDNTTGTGGFISTLTTNRGFDFGSTAGGTSTNAPNLSLISGTVASSITTGSWFNKLDFGTTQYTVPIASLNLNSLILSANGNFTNLTATMVDTGTIISSNNTTLATLVINHTGTTTLGSALTTTTSTTLTSGTLSLAGFTLTPTQFISGTAATRVISGTGIISLANNWTVTNGTGFTGSDYTINMTSATAKTFAGAGGTYGILIQAGAGALTISGSNTFADIQATVRPSTIRFTSASTQTVSLFTVSGTSGKLITLNSTIAGNRFNLSKSSGTVNDDFLSIKDSNVTGGAGWYAGNNSTNQGNNLGWTFTSAPGALPVTGQFLAFFF